MQPAFVDGCKQAVTGQEGGFQMFHRNAALVQGRYHFIQINNFYKSVRIDDDISQQIGDN